MRTLKRSLTFEYTTFDETDCETEMEINLIKVKQTLELFVESFDKLQAELYLNAEEKFQGFEFILNDNLGNILKQKFNFNSLFVYSFFSETN